jgi:hypothetical protein
MRRTILQILLLITVLGMFGCVDIPTDSNSSPYEFTPDYGDDAILYKTNTKYDPNNLELSCVVLFEKREYWSPIDSATPCPECYVKSVVGYSVGRLEGSCTKGRFSLYKHKTMYGCFKYCDRKDTGKSAL